MEPKHCVRVMRRMALQFEVVRLFVVISDQPFVAVAKIYGREIGHEYQAVPAQVEVAMNRLAHHAADVGTVRVGPALVQLARHGRAADVIVFLEYHDL